MLFVAAFALPSLVQCEYPWPDKVTQHKGYIEVLLKGPVIAIMCAHLQPALHCSAVAADSCLQLVGSLFAVVIFIATMKFAVTSIEVSYQQASSCP